MLVIESVKIENQKLACRRAFTVVELLVVLVSLLVVAAVLLPALAATRPRTQRVVCANNIKQLTLAEIMYCDANTRSVPDTAPDGLTGAWFINLRNYFGGATNSLMFCPAASQPAIQPGTSVSTGNAVTPWCRVDTFGDFSSYFGSYSFNGWLFTKRTDPNSGDGDGLAETLPGGSGSTGYYLTANAVSVPARTPVFSDGFWVDSWPTEVDAACHDTRGMAGPGSPNLGSGGSIHHEMARVAMARHACNPFAANTWTTPLQTPVGGVNVGCFDGHVESSSLPNLWRYNWHNGWRQSSVFIGTPY